MSEIIANIINSSPVFVANITEAGPTGLSAWEYAKSKGYAGTEAEFATAQASLPLDATHAADSALAASTSETNAGTYATNAHAAQTAAESAQSGAISAKDAAVIAKTASETAQGLAETANTSAQGAKTAAETAQGLAETAQTAAQGYASTAHTDSLTATTAKNDAETAQTAAELAETHAETAESNASTHATNADNARIAAQTAQTNAELAETHAETAEVNAETAETNAVAAKNAAELALTHAPYIDDTNGNWFIWNATTSAYVDSGTYATGAVYQAEAPTGVVLWIDSDDDAISSVTKADIGLANVDNTSDTAKPVSTAQQTALNLKVNTSAIVNNLTTGGTAVPLSAEQGKTLSTSISELNADVDFNVTSLMTNGDFSIGTTGWASAGGVLSASSNTLTITGNGVTANPYASQALAMVLNHKYYIRSKMKVTNASCNQIRTRFAGGSGELIVTSPIANQQYSMSMVLTSLDSVNYTNAVQHTYADAATANGKVMEVQYVLCIDLTAAFGAGNEPTAAEMDAILAYYANSWFNGTVNIATNPKIIPYLMSMTRNRPIITSGTYAARPTSVTFPTLYLSTDKAAGNADRLTLNVGGTTWLQI